MKIQFVDAGNADLLSLIHERDACCMKVVDTRQRSLDSMACAVVAYVDEKAAGCGCWRACDPVTAGIEQMYVCEAYRGQNVAGSILQALEQHAAASGCHRAIVQIDTDMAETIAFYDKQGYEVGGSTGNTTSVCMEKEISDGTMR